MAPILHACSLLLHFLTKGEGPNPPRETCKLHLAYFFSVASLGQPGSSYPKYSSPFRLLILQANPPVSQLDLTFLGSRHSHT